MSWKSEFGQFVQRNKSRPFARRVEVVLPPPIVEAPPAPPTTALAAAPPTTKPKPRRHETVIAPPPAVFQGPPPAPKPPPPALQQAAPAAATGTGTWAVVIGVNDYPGDGNDLRSAVNDANDMDLALSQLGVPADHRLVLRDGQATGGVIRGAAEWLVRNAGPDAVAVFFYSGHIRKEGDTKEAMVGSDGQTVSDAQLAGLLSRLAAKRAWVAMVGCYGGGFTEVLAPGRILTGAADANSLAYESSLFNRSYMVQYMVREAFIEKKAAHSVQTAFAYANSEIAREHPGRQPVQVDAGSGPLDLRPGATSRPGTAAPPPTTTTTQPRKCFLICNNNGS